MGSQELKGHLDSLILATLAEAPGHGYLIVEALKRRSHGALDIPEGTIYPALHRLEAAGVLRSEWSEAAGRRRRVYALTRSGRSELERRRREWRDFSAAMSAVMM